MNQVDRDALVTDYEPHLSGLTLPDPNDRHVLAAAVQAKAAVIVSFNLRDFPASVLLPLGITAQPPDGFICDLYAADPNAVMERVRLQRAALHRPVKSPQQFVDSLRQNRLHNFADSLLPRLDEI